MSNKISSQEDHYIIPRRHLIEGLDADNKQDHPLILLNNIKVQFKRALEELKIDYPNPRFPDPNHFGMWSIGKKKK